MEAPVVPEAAEIQTGRWKLAFWVLLTALGLFKLITLTHLPLTGDEAYHWEWSRRLGWGYYDHPPLVAWMIRASTESFGTSLFSVRFPAWLCSVAYLAVLGFTAHQVSKSWRIAFWATLAIACFPIWNVSVTLITTDPPYALFFILSAVALAKAFETEKWGWWLAFGVFTGFTILGKLLGLTVFLSALLAVVLNPKLRPWLRRPQPYVATLIALLVWSPNLVWNAQNDWATFMFHTMIRNEAKPFPTHLVQFVLGQPLIAFPIFFGALVAMVLRHVEDRRNLSAGQATFLAFSIPLPTLGLLMSFRSEVGIHWTSVAYLTAAPIGFAMWLGKAPKPRGWFHAGWITPAVCLVALHFVLFDLAASVKAVDGISGSASPWGNNKSGRDLGALFGWNELGTRLAELSDEEGGSPLLLTTNYAFCAVGSFSTPGRPTIFHFGQPSPYGRMYEYWQRDLVWRGRDAIYFRDKPPAKGTEATLARAFMSFESLPALEVRVNGLVARTWYFYRCRGFRENPWQAYLDDPLKP